MSSKKSSSDINEGLKIGLGIFFGISSLAIFFQSIKGAFISLFSIVALVVMFSSKLDKHIQKINPETGIKGKKVKLIGGLLFVVLTLLLANPLMSESDNSQFQKLQQKGPYDVVSEYINKASYSNIDEDIESISSRLHLTSGFMHTFLKTSLGYKKGHLELVEEIQENCKGLWKFDLDVCDQITKEKSWPNHIAKVSNVQISLIEETEDSAKVRVIRDLEVSEADSTETYTDDTIYYLVKSGEYWSINDYMRNGEMFSESFDLDLFKEETSSILNDIEESTDVIIDNLELFQQAIVDEKRIKQTIEDNVDNIDIRYFSSGWYEDQLGKYVIFVKVNYQDQWLVDDYLGFVNLASKIYQSSFILNSDVMSVQIEAYQKVTDDFGHTQSTLLGRSTMDRTTASRINWDGFETSNLAKITPVSFYGDSLYKDLVDLQEDLESWDSIASYDYTYPGWS